MNTRLKQILLLRIVRQLIRQIFMEKYFGWQNLSCLLDIIGISVFNTKLRIQKYFRLINLHDRKDIIARYSALTET